MPYKKIWITAYGPIPKDKDGKSYEIHHIDGNHNNNALSNLKLVSIQEHYDIHCSQGDWGAAFAIARRMAMQPKDISDLARKASLVALSKGKNNFITDNPAKRRVERGSHNFLNHQNTRKSVENGTFVGFKKYKCTRCGRVSTKAGFTNNKQLACTPDFSKPFIKKDGINEPNYNCRR